MVRLDKGSFNAGARNWAAEDVIGQCRITSLRGEHELRVRTSSHGSAPAPSGASEQSGDQRHGHARQYRDNLHIVSCHECTVYVLAPVQTVLISNCGHSTVVVRRCSITVLLQYEFELHLQRDAWR